LETARKNRLEDWNLGPLRPNRAIGRDAEKYGALEAGQMRLIDVPEHMRRKEWPIVEGDRVVIIKGRNRGKIGVVKKLSKTREEVQIKDLNMAYADGSAWNTPPGETPKAKQETEQVIPYSDIRLVATIYNDPRNNGQDKDVIVDSLNMVRQGKSVDPITDEPIYKRYVTGTDIEIAFPEKPEPNIVDYASDTLRITVEERSFIPTLLMPPIPESVIDELRGKYSKFRTRHDEEFLEKVKRFDDHAEVKKELIKTMKTPLQVLREQAREQKEKRPKPELTDDLLARIGQIMQA
ncbi:hypothetical protein K469DRAFT_502648, partial [Zopfia rhizophila CBS 207.26]